MSVVWTELSMSMYWTVLPGGRNSAPHPARCGLPLGLGQPSRDTTAASFYERGGNQGCVAKLKSWPSCLQLVMYQRVVPYYTQDLLLLLLGRSTSQLI